MSTAFVERLLRIADEDGRIMLVVSDRCLPLLRRFLHRLPQQLICLADSDETLAGVAAGLALDGRVVYACSLSAWSFLPFVRQLRSSSRLEGTIVNLISMGHCLDEDATGLAARDTEDLSLMRSVAGVTVLAPGTEHEAAESAEAVACLPGISYIRLGGGLVDATADASSQPFEIGRCRTLRSGNDITLLAAGGMVRTALDAAEQLWAVDNLESRVVSCPSLSPVDHVAIEAAARDTGGIVCLEDHAVNGGLGSAAAEVLIESGTSVRRFARLGLRMRPAMNEPGWQAYLADQQLDVDSICRAVQSLLAVRRWRSAA